MSSNTTAGSGEPPRDLVDTLDDFLTKYYHDEVCQLATTYPSTRVLEVDFNDLYKYSPDVADDLQSHPDLVLEAFTEAVRLHDTPVATTLSGVEVNITGFGDAERRDVGDYVAEEIGRFVPVTGQVAKVSQKQPDVTTAVFVCQRCGAETTVPQPETGDFQEPYACESCERQGPFEFLKSDSSWRTQQMIRLQQPPEQVADGTGATIDLTVYDGLCESVTPGDRATIGGTLSAADPREGREFAMTGRSIEPEESDYDEAAIEEYREEIQALVDGEYGPLYEVIPGSIAPAIHGEEYDDIKLALALQLAAGVRVTHPSGKVDRGRFHMLLLGDPGTAKSELVEAANQIAPRSVFTSGEGVSKVGLTASVVPDDFGDGKWSLEAGPMVKANEGICCVDEIDKADEDAIEGLHTALEKQVVTVSKASFSGVQMQARTSLLAAGNPKYGRFDPYEPVADQIELTPTLMSRFDLMFMLTDRPDRERDEAIIEHMLEDRHEAVRYQRGDISAEDADRIEPPVPHDVLQAYFAYIHERDPQPVIPEEIRERIKEFLVDFRNTGDEDDSVPVTLRKVEAIERLVEASARLRLEDEEASMEDAKRAIRLVTKTMRDVGRDPETGEFDADIIETGRSQNQHDRRKTLLDVVEEIDAEEPGATREQVLERMEDEGYGRDHVEHDIETLREKGDLWDDEHGLHVFW